MALCASGAMSLGGATTGRSVNLELGCSATAAICMNRTDVRSLAEVASGAIAMSNFYGKSSAPPAPTALGTWYSDYGGYYTGTSSGYYLFAIVDGAVGTFIAWKTTQSSSPGTCSITDGYSNTYAQKNSDHPLFNCVGNLSYGGFSDWYIGAKCEVQLQYNNRNCGSQGYPSGAMMSSMEASAACYCSLNFGNATWYGDTVKTLGNQNRAIRRQSI